MNLIVAVDNNFGIGLDSSLLYDIPADMEHFKKTTLNKIVVMGDNTLKSLPGAKPLKNRENIIISNNPSFKVEGATVLYSQQDVLNHIKQFQTDDVFVIGGAYVYKEFLPYCTFAYITRVDTTKSANKFFPNIDKMDNWKLIKKSEDYFQDDLKFNFCIYKNHKVLAF